MIPSATIVIVSLEELAKAIEEIQRKAVDGTIVPLFVDYQNSRVIIGSTSISSSPAKMEVSGGDLKVVTTGYGVIVPNRSGTQYYRIMVEDDGAISANPL